MKYFLKKSIVFLICSLSTNINKNINNDINIRKHRYTFLARKLFLITSLTSLAFLITAKPTWAQDIKPEGMTITLPSVEKPQPKPEAPKVDTRVEPFKLETPKTEQPRTQAPSTLITPTSTSTQPSNAASGNSGSSGNSGNASEKKADKISDEAKKNYTFINPEKKAQQSQSQYAQKNESQNAGNIGNKATNFNNTAASENTKTSKKTTDKTTDKNAENATSTKTSTKTPAKVELPVINKNKTTNQGSSQITSTASATFATSATSRSDAKANASQTSGNTNINSNINSNVNVNANSGNNTQNVLSLGGNPTIKPLAIQLPRTGAAVAGAAAGSANKLNDSPNAGAYAQIKQIMQFGQVLHMKNLGDGLRAWVLEKNQKKIVLYTTASQKLIISGMVWDTKTKKNITQDVLVLLNQPPSFSLKEYLAQPMQYDSTKNIAVVNNAAGSAGITAASGAAGTSGTLSARSNSNNMIASNVPPSNNIANASNVGNVGNIGNMGIQKLIIPSQTPPAINQLKALAGIEEKSAKNNEPLDTFYIIFDPRCSYCDKLYQNTREYVKKGYAIKWIPAILMGEDTKAQQQAAYLLQQNNGQLLGRLFSQKYTPTISVSDVVKKQLTQNQQYFFEANRRYKITQAGIPAALFFDKRAGTVRMVLGIADAKILQDAFLGI